MSRRTILACILMALPGLVALTEASNPVPHDARSIRLQARSSSEATRRRDDRYLSLRPVCRGYDVLVVGSCLTSSPGTPRSPRTRGGWKD